MSAFPDFSKLLAAVAAMGADLDDCLSSLHAGVPVTSEEEYVAAPNGFYDVLPSGHIVRLIIHLGQGDNAHCHDDPERWHRFHTGRCTAYGPPSRQLRFFKTRRADGRFTYFLYDFYDQEYRPEERIKGRALRLCGHCRNKLGKLSLLDERGEPDLDELFSGTLTRRLHRETIHLDHDRISGFPEEDWKAIARYVKSRAVGHCSRCARDMRPLPKNLHAHYTEDASRPAVLGRVTALCAGCHAQEKGHELLRQKVRVSAEFLDFRKTFPDHPALIGSLSCIADSRLPNAPPTPSLLRNETTPPF